VCNADRSGKAALTGKLFEGRDPPGTAKPLQAPVDYGDARRIIATIFQAPQSLEQDGDDIAFGNGADDSTHDSSS
jgi:hypothetical protein